MSATDHGRPPQIPFDEENAQARPAARQIVRLLPDGEGLLAWSRRAMGAIRSRFRRAAARLFPDSLTQLGQGRAVAIAPGRRK